MAALEAALIALGPLEARNLFFRKHAFDRVKYTVEGIDLPVGLEGDAGRAGRVLGLLWFTLGYEVSFLSAYEFEQLKLRKKHCGTTRNCHEAHACGTKFAHA